MRLWMVALISVLPSGTVAHYCAPDAASLPVRSFRPAYGKICRPSGRRHHYTGNMQKYNNGEAFLLLSFLISIN